MRRIFFVAIAVIAVALATDAFFIEPYDIEVTHTVVMALVNAPLKIAELTDLHTTKFGRLERKLVVLLDEEKPDVIVITGDTLGRDSDYRDIRPLLRQLHAPLGVWLVRGNWERNGIPRNEHRFYASVGVNLLLNEAKPIRDDVWLVGVDDVMTGNPDIDIALKAVPPNVYPIALFHEPGYFDRVAGKVPLALAGHTHGGQVRIPFVPVFWLPRGSDGFLEGWFAEKNSRMYVSRGIGTSNLPVRFLCRPELAIITLEPSATPPQPGGSSRQPSA